MQRSLKCQKVVSIEKKVKGLRTGTQSAALHESGGGMTFKLEAVVWGLQSPELIPSLFSMHQTYWISLLSLSGDVFLFIFFSGCPRFGKGIGSSDGRAERSPSRILTIKENMSYSMHKCHRFVNIVFMLSIIKHYNVSGLL